MASSDKDPTKTTPETQTLEHAIEQFSRRSDIYIFGHATSTAETAQSIVKSGLNLSSPDLWSTVVGLPTVDIEPDAIEQNTSKITEKTHRGRQYVVLLGVEKYADPEDIPDPRYLSSIVQPITDEAGDEIGNVIDRRFIAGYFDVKDNLFVPNPDFTPKYDPTLMNTTSDVWINVRRNPVSIGAMATHDEGQPVSIPVPLEHPDSNAPLVW